MKIAFISPSFFESTFPLAKHIGLKNDVTVYCFMNQSMLNPPMLNLSGLTKKGLLSDKESFDCLQPELKLYFENSGITIRIVVCGNSKEIGALTILEFVRELKRNQFDYLHFIGEEFRFNFIQSFFPNRKIIQTLHEGDLGRLTKKTGKLKTLLLKLFLNKLGSNSVKLIFNSENVRRNFLQNYPLKAKELTSVIHFGVFEMYNYFSTAEVKIELPDSYFLYYGYIEPYKGVDILLDAVKKINQDKKNIKFLIAGRDKGGLLSITPLPNVTFLNRFLTEGEIALLVKNAVAVIMPYRSASQSGIPNTTFCFNVPIIASDIPGINHVIKHRQNGLLFKAEDINELAECIIDLNDDKNLLMQLKDNISKQNDFESWDSLALLATDFYKA